MTEWLRCVLLNRDCPAPHPERDDAAAIRAARLVREEMRGNVETMERLAVQERLASDLATTLLRARDRDGDGGTW